MIAYDRAQLSEMLTVLPRRRALVMTMGALHEGHLDLVRAAKKVADHVIVSIFVNPTQFAPGEDFSAYPRDLDADVALLQPLGVDLVFAPTAEVLYPRDYQAKTDLETKPGLLDGVGIDPGPVAQILEGATRPTHFAGVCQVVGKVMHLISPQIAVFGRKDAQQLAIISAMVRDLDFPVQILPVDIRREADGLAMSSRNRYLCPSDRSKALSLYQSLLAGKDCALQGGNSEQVILSTRERLEQGGVEVDYVALVDENFTPVNQGFTGPATLAVAGRVGTTRLIDNMLVSL